MTMQLRVLTGTHAGARLDLAQGRYTLGSDPQTDIRIDDWPGCSLILEVDHDGQIRYSSDALPETSFVAFHPVRFGPLVLCVGEAGADWPDDVALLERLLSPAPPSAPRTSRRKFLRTAVGAVLALAAAALLPSLQPAFLSDAATRQHPENTLNQAKALLKQLDFREAHVEQVGTRVLIEGLVPSSADAARLRAQVHRYHPGVAVNVAVVDEVVATLRDTLADPALTVRYEGNGVFSVSGSSDYAERASRRIADVRSDLGPEVRALHVEISQQDPSIKPPDNYDAALLADGLHYVETPDGTKHMTSLPQQAAQ
ncbi:HrpD5 family protein [Xanthomonas euvesicatoria pv. eucalypti]|uniref:HrpD5 family protein n=1 Tax=Xanthomonas TaxID=338 RepID=UPI0026E2BC95|nr:HrpD5 family protein [Xanthomonas euvesicatoria]MDO7932345.1 HrpD5 family protein [Xanthomonas euvesicatoria pv. eucalypti]MDO7936904.1 HrpD5 family protein [Xanthomonas euvesicatoria pv. eucalypti]MDO7940713.1 HrpD5 family protein [Xanthomonas euvesicatoria pv. eucalypti]MDO7945247.1 HrpD5 family protein [Xanthomonas euvesicatoria pv. eucalypti]MDO7948103.1 HrpD5 family protein [Xanthomonas euvesicatoria pv. eucalypti]